MLSLSEYNFERSSVNRGFDASCFKGVLNGISCPDCGEELVDVDQTKILCSHPPKLEVMCTFCGFKSFRLT